jgi:hypothetical protein
MRQVDVARQKGFELYGCNRTFIDIPDLSVLYAVNTAFWDYYWNYENPSDEIHEQLRVHPCQKWTTNSAMAAKYGLYHFFERAGQGLCTDPKTIHHGHGAGYSLLGIAHKLGATRIILLGYDLKYAADYDGKAKKIGSTPRHYFDEYPAEMQHWPSVQVKDGVHVELLELYKSIKDQGLVEVINCSPDSALECFERMPIEEVDGNTSFVSSPTGDSNEDHI